MFKRIGELLVSYGELTTADLSLINAEQKRYYRPFGKIAAEMFNVSENALWQAWAEQYAAYCPRINISEQAPLTHLGLRKEITAAQAHHYHLLPLCYHDGDLILVTAIEYLADALRFLDERGREKTSALVWLTEQSHELERALEQAYPVPTPS